MEKKDFLFIYCQMYGAWLSSATAKRQRGQNEQKLKFSALFSALHSVESFFFPFLRSCSAVMNGIKKANQKNAFKTVFCPLRLVFFFNLFLNCKVNQKQPKREISLNFLTLHEERRKTGESIKQTPEQSFFRVASSFAPGAAAFEGLESRTIVEGEENEESQNGGRAEEKHEIFRTTPDFPSPSNSPSLSEQTQSRNPAIDFSSTAAICARFRLRIAMMNSDEEHKKKVDL
jgi:hypothetical protein